MDKTLYVSGQLGLDTQTGCLVEGGVEAEAKKALDNLGHILDAAGASFKNGNLSFHVINYHVFFSFSLISIGSG